VPAEKKHPIVSKEISIPPLVVGCISLRRC
jgi:hypothetical protein